jgi:hypothetical protein
MTTKTRRRPEKSIKDAVGSDAVVSKKNPLEKSLTTMAVTKAEGDDDGLSTTGVTTPTPEQMALITPFLRTPKNPEDIAVFSTWSCNDMYDRDDDGFRRGAIKQMTELQPPYSFVGKSFMLNHDYVVQSAVGRIFDERREVRDGIEFLVHDVYVPRIPSNEEFLANQDFGIYWAVSVGLVLESSACTVCDAPFGRWWCAEGHEKGFHYDPKSDETDSWGWPLPVPEGTNGAVKCQRDLFDPKDGYEVSQVFLGAQYWAELQKDPEFEGIVKAAGARPIVSLSDKQAQKLPMRHEPERVAEARQKYVVTTDDDGDPTWTDETGLKWVYNTTQDEVMCLGKDANDGEGQVRDGSTADGPELRADGEPVVEPVADPPEDGVGGSGQLEAADPEDGGQDLGDEGSLSTDEEGDQDVDKAAVVAAAKAANINKSHIDAIEASEGNGLSVLLSVLNQEVVTLQAEVNKLTPLAAHGEEFMKSLRSEALDWYCKANQTGDGPVSTAMFERMLDRCDGDVELMRSIISEQKTAAQIKFPGVRRSSDADDHHQAEAEEVDAQAVTNSSTAKVIGLHSR